MLQETNLWHASPKQDGLFDLSILRTCYYTELEGHAQPCRATAGHCLPPPWQRESIAQMRFLCYTWTQGAFHSLSAFVTGLSSLHWAIIQGPAICLWHWQYRILSSFK